MTSSTTRRLSAVIAGFCVVAGGVACGGSDPGDAAAGEGTESIGVVASADEPVTGGRLRFGLEAETTGGFCLPEAQFVASGLNVANAVYDTLLLPSGDGAPEPGLAESYTVNEDATEFRFVIRQGVRFHDGSELDPEVVALNLQLLSGDPAQVATTSLTPLLIPIVFSDVESIEVDGDAVVLRTSRPWPQLPTYLTSARFGMSAEAQLRSESCADEMIGTGPFSLVEWRRNESVELVRNEDYWRTDAAGRRLPYLDELEFVPIPSSATREDAVRAGTVDAAMFGTSVLLDAPEFDVFHEAPGRQEVSYLMLNQSRPGLADRATRRHLAMAIDRAALNDAVNEGEFRLAEQPFDTEVNGYVEGQQLPAYDPAAAAAFFEGRDLELSLVYAASPSGDRQAQEVVRQLGSVGVTVDSRAVDQATLVNVAIAGDYDLMPYRNHPGADPDTQYVWWRTGSPINFGRIDDPQLDALMDAGRSTLDAGARAETYRQVSDRFASEVHNLWTWYAGWSWIGDPALEQLGYWTQLDGTEGMGMRWGTSYWAEVWRSDG